jgi:hypothetical protein
MKTQGLWSRWHRFSNNGVKYIKRFKFDETPSPLTEEGYTEWRRGTGPLAPEHYTNVAEGVRKRHQGVPKSETTKYKMRLAKLGVPKSEEHKENMSEAWKRKRLERYQRVMQSLSMDTQRKKMGAGGA